MGRWAHHACCVPVATRHWLSSKGTAADMGWRCTQREPSMGARLRVQAGASFTTVRVSVQYVTAAGQQLPLWQHMHWWHLAHVVNACARDSAVHPAR